MKLTPKKYAQALVEVLESSTNQKAMIENFLLFLRRKKQFRLLPKIVKSFEKQWNASHGVVKITAWYPDKFKDSPEQLATQLHHALGKEIILDAKPEKDLIGGFKVVLDDTMLDASIQGQLAVFANRFSLK